MPDLFSNYVASIVDDLAHSDSQKIVLVGNQVLSPDGGYSDTYGIYPEATIALSQGIIRGFLEVNQNTRRGIYLLTLINDWKWLKGLPNGPEIRRQYWENEFFDYLKVYPQLQEYFLSGLGQHTSKKEPQGRISEQRLHNHHTTFERRNSEFFNKVLSEFEGNCPVGHCGAGKCASEVIMLLRHLYRLNVDHAVFLLPSECYYPIETGISMAQALQPVLMPKLKAPFRVDHISLNSGQPKTFEALLDPPNLPELRRRISHLIEVE